MFGQTGQQFAFMSHSHNQKLGLQAVGSHWKASIFLMNIWSLIYGNQAAGLHGYAQALNISIHDYVALLDSHEDNWGV